ncbi:hypothetical protein GMDG_07756 [Pseudogymnoascus destructans 20631-21]|uniref:Reverse transcriptase domain-containing protein n=1 Tax=Pseudogymnoascus destructans (strain ATCC MYA-4855 / 20631-21) TaxID=658429 RepID=L8FYG3_PSED2|nr:hypothetical protein GMDG_07756 [Pseudogymnoascus destructans 20631-21]
MEMKVIISDYEEITDTPSNPLRNQEVSPPPQKTLVHRFTPCISAKSISANAFHHEMMRSDSEFFQTSIYEIDQIIHEKELDEDAETLYLIQQKLPHMHRSYANLKAPLPNAFSLLYRQGTEELKATKQYLLENLEKGFIVNSNSPFAKKADGKLRFCIDYRKLNGLTRNDPT